MYPNEPKVSFEPMPLPQVPVTPAWLPKIILKRLRFKFLKDYQIRGKM